MIVDEYSSQGPLSRLVRGILLSLYENEDPLLAVVITWENLPLVRDLSARFNRIDTTLFCHFFFLVIFFFFLRDRKKHLTFAMFTIGTETLIRWGLSNDEKPGMLRFGCNH